MQVIAGNPQLAVVSKPKDFPTLCGRIFYVSWRHTLYLHLDHRRT